MTNTKQPSPSESAREWLDKQLTNPRSLPSDAWIAAETEFDGCVILLEKFTESLERENATLRQIVGELVRTLVTAHKELRDYCATNQSEWTKRVRDSVAEEIRRAQEAIKP